MIYFSIDLETTGVNWKEHSILEFGAIMEDTENQLSFEEIPKFNCLLKYKNYVGSPYALAMHKQIFEELDKEITIPGCTIIPYNKLGFEFAKWIFKLNEERISKGKKFFDKLIVAGKNFATFDMRFLENLEDFQNNIWFSSRVIDPAIFYFDNKIDKDLPNLKICKERAGIKNTEIAHRTIQDAWDVIQVLRGKMY